MARAAGKTVATAPASSTRAAAAPTKGSTKTVAKRATATKTATVTSKAVSAKTSTKTPTKVGSAGRAKATPVKAAAKPKATPGKPAPKPKSAAPPVKAATKLEVTTSAPAARAKAQRSPSPAIKAPATKAPAAKAASAKAPPTTEAPNVPAAGKTKTVPVTNETSAPNAARPFGAPPKRKPGTVICPLSGFEVKPESGGLAERTIERLRVRLLEERERHLHQADELQAEAEALAAEREGGDTQFDEESGEGDTLNIERERDLLLSASARQTVDEIDRALARVADGSYGRCVPAGRRISIERLEALPYAETCVDCKARAERRR